MKLVYAATLGLGSLAFGFEQTPWVDFPYEFQLRTSFFESYYSAISDSYPFEAKYKNSFNEELKLNIGVATLSQVDFQIESEFFQSKATTFTLESIGFFVRSQVLDDVQGDWISATIGTSIRYVPDHALHDPFVPYHNLFNFEGNLALGKEFDEAFDWTKRGSVFFAVGIATQSAAYIKFDGLFEFHRMSHLFGCFFKSYFGLGNKKQIDLAQFHGYGKYMHQSVDVGLCYKYLFDIYGALSIEASYRFYAFAFPENETAIEIRYQLPFSVF